MKTVIVEDEHITAEELVYYLKKIDNQIEILATCESVEDAISYFEENGCPDLIFSDIQLADGLSFEIYEQVKITCPIIFCTAFDEYAMQAFNANGIDYILKPFDQKAIERSITKFHSLKDYFRKSAPDIHDDQIKNLLVQLRPKTKRSSILINYKGKFFPVPVSEISFFYTENEIVWLIKTNGDKFAVNYTLDDLEEFLDGEEFYRANRQYIINKTAVKEFEPYFNRKLAVKLYQDAPEVITVSKVKATEFMKWMEH